MLGALNSSRSLPPRPAAWQRWLALGSVAVVFLLGVFGANAELHAALHDDHAVATSSAQGDTCAVVLFASGTEPPVEGVFVSPLAAPVTVARVVELEREYAEARHRLPPAQAPPRV